MTVLQIIQELARRVKDPVVSSLQNNDDTANELLGYLESSVGQIYGEYDWDMLRRVHEFNSIIGQSLYQYPSDFNKFMTYGIYLPELKVWVSAESADESFKRQTSGITGDTANKYRQVMDGVVFTYPFHTATTCKYEYKSKNFVKSTDTAGNVIFTDFIAKDNDELLFDKELVILGAIAQRAITLESNNQSIAIQAYAERLERLKNQQQPPLHGNAFSSPLDTRTLSVARVYATGGGSY
jgi:hypothetical protein